MSVERLAVLHVDDDELLLRSCARLWSRTWRVFSVTTVEDAMTVARSEHLDVALVDLNLPEPIGLEVIAGIKEVQAGVHTVLTSGGLTVDWAHAARIADDVIPKPFSIDEVIVRRDDPTKRLATSHAHRTPTLDAVEYDYMRQVLSDCHGNKSLAARRLGISRTKLQRVLGRDRPRQ